MDRASHIVIIGAGMGGLACALSLAKEGFTNIDVYETASNLGFVGAGIQLAPNMARVLDRLGCWKEIEAEAVDLKETSIRQGDSDNELAHVDLLYIRDTYGYPHMVGHRSNLAGSMYEACKKESGIKFHFSTAAEAVESFGPKPVLKVKPREGESYTVEADVILASDGIKSIVRSKILAELNHDAHITDTNQAAYRIMLKREDMENDTELLELINGDKVTRWIGEKRHIIAYPVSSKQIYNLSTVQPDTNFAAAPSATYTTKGDKAAMLNIFSDFCPKVQRMLNLVPDGEVCEWKLRVHSPLPTWVRGSIALVGDACHPTLPHLAQGAAQAIEDAAVLGAVFSKCPSSDPSDINKSLLVYESVRKERAETLVELAAQSGRALHLGDGAAKAERDKQFAALKQKGGAVPDKWADSEVQKKIYGFDCYQIALDRFDDLFAKVKEGQFVSLEQSVNSSGENGNAAKM
ncbi:hypothetical protein SS1G_12382 [Sclerotinia sclerotiorum 1980 UF-70]|uniref:FAD-binding domain-containing protein n=2 Tax=Sclerotinia sclerotiorum (strain ATCC 18683 / 1980 / Ss-1) TaxID=665079 RepID=A7F460_SCLS1|nr:hypothetical protein SS1G_12382 [Sclerotinia sclerotiorum 1980 UF-70]APA10748.1 hypothetical protein sscle_06g055180 [Sclerotinia sclerotiorum 1980 UF-70]EDN97531.1 hypothetical protein SS1G_12382 [Sclerotinia sclerotiorum 1980 UF-70]